MQQTTVRLIPHTTERFRKFWAQFHTIQHFESSFQETSRQFINNVEAADSVSIDILGQAVQQLEGSLYSKEYARVGVPSLSNYLVKVGDNYRLPDIFIVCLTNDNTVDYHVVVDLYGPGVSRADLMNIIANRRVMVTNDILV